MYRIFKSLECTITALRDIPTTHNMMKNYFISRIQLRRQSNLALLRKKTGLPIIKCKEALTKFSNLEEAESWLEEEARKEGMQRVSLGRATTNGVVALNIIKQESMIRTTLIELNCETDHLSLSEEFRQLAAKICQLITNSSLSAGSLTPENMLAVPQDNGLTALDAITRFVGRAKETTTLKRGAIHDARGDICIGSYVHNALDLSSCDSVLKVGTHASFVEIERLEGESIDTQLLADQLAQHVVGMPQEGAEDKIETLLEQDWLFDLDRTVNSVLGSNQLKCVHFVRYQVGK
ncbi:hypothetical protein LOD99_1355 [Oopsacas minuta]|uniref:Elongation factor Ts, mitochondrial n=1 Tax=Oopsacas minuta TaxID=111878 RepID=A0AAV7K7B2_9METZ|nr:hypothetical protein LOD99_1355 [Oopsacas minuta]